MMPAAAFVHQESPPKLQILVNSQPIKDDQIVFPMSVLPIVSTKVEGSGLTSAKLGKEATFTISCFSFDNKPSSTGFHDASVYLLQSGVDNPEIINCNTLPINPSGIVKVTYTIPPQTGIGNYHCYIFVNSEQISESPTTVHATTDTTDEPDQAYEIGHYQVASPAEQWNIDTNKTWTIDTTKDLTTLNTQQGTYDENKKIAKFELKLPVTDDWFHGEGFMFTFDITLKSTASNITLFPIAQSTTPISMLWRRYHDPGNGQPDYTKSDIFWYNGDTTSDHNIIKVPRPERLHITATDAATICYHYMVSPDESEYILHVFQAGQFITKGSWPRNKQHPSPPALGLALLSFKGSTIGISNVTTVPTRFRPIPQLTATSDSFEEPHQPSMAVDDNAKTFWHSELRPFHLPLPHSIVIDLHAQYPVQGLQYSPQQGDIDSEEVSEQRIGEYSIHLSPDGANWEAACPPGSFTNDAYTKTVKFPSKMSRFVRLTAITEAGNHGQGTSASNISVLYAPHSGAEVVLSQPWAIDYVVPPTTSGTYSNRGLIINGNKKDVTTSAMSQNEVPKYGCSIAVYSFKAQKVYDFGGTGQSGFPSFPAVCFQGPYWNLKTGKWVNWTPNNLEEITDSNLKQDSETVNTVMVVAGESCVTVFSNRAYQFSITKTIEQPITKLSSPQVVSLWTDIT